MIIECYHTLENQGNPDYVERYGPFACSRKDAWLGTGYYFWDTNIQWAHEWGKVYANGYFICQVSIQHDETIFDLYGNVSHMMAFTKAFEILKSRVPPSDHAKILVRDVIEALKKTGSFPYNGIRANHEHSRSLTVKFNSIRHEYLIINSPVQICLLNKKNLISQTFRIVFPEDYV